MQTNEPAELIEIDATEFSRTLESHRRELHVHCYRMTGSLTDAEDLVQETFLRAWRAKDDFEWRSSTRTWLYRIATNACLDARKRADRRTIPAALSDDPLESDRTIQPYPDSMLFGSPGEDPANAVVARETIELVFIAALTRLPPRQRAAFIARDVLELSAAETAVLLDVSETSANSLVQRARTTMRAHIRAVDVSTRTAEIADVEDKIVRQYVEAHERGDHEAIVAILRADVRITMPPERACIGLEAATAFFAYILGPGGPGDWRLVPTRANNRPAVANYLRHPGEQAWRALSIDLLDIVDGQLRTINCFLGHEPFALFGLEPELPPDELELA